MSGEARSSEDAAVALVRRYGPAIRAFFRRRVRNREDAEELTQEVFASLARRAELGTIASPDRYLFQSAANLLRDRARRASTRPMIEHVGFADPGQRLVDELSPERLLEGKQTYALFLQALHALPERPRTVFILNRFEEMSGREIALRLGISQRLVEMDLARVLKVLRETLP